MRAYFIGTIAIFSAIAACSKDPPAPTPQAAPSAASTQSPSVAVPVTTTQATSVPSAAPTSSATGASDEPAGPTACPSINEWSRLSGFASDCSYMWTRTPANLPKSPEWVQCDIKSGDPITECKKFIRTGTVDNLTAGVNSSGKTQVGFVENCPQPQIVIADVDGPTRFALRSTLYSGEPSACMLKLLAVDLGRWLAVMGGSQASDDPQYGMAVGHAYVGGQTGIAPNILQLDTKFLFDVQRAGGGLNSEGWFAGESKKRWNGKDIETPAPHDYQILTGKVLATMKRGIFVQAEPTPKLIVDTPADRDMRHYRRREQQVAWLEELYAVKGSTCWLVVGDLDKNEMITKVRRIGKVPCPKQHFQIGCNSAIISNDTDITLVSLVDGSTRKLKLVAEALAVDCKEVFVKDGAQLLRVELSAFSPAEPASEPPVELPVLNPSADMDAGVPDAAAPDAAAVAPASSASSK